MLYTPKTFRVRMGLLFPPNPPARVLCIRFSQCSGIKTIIAPKINHNYLVVIYPVDGDRHSRPMMKCCTTTRTNNRLRVFILFSGDCWLQPYHNLIYTKCVAYIVYCVRELCFGRFGSHSGGWLWLQCRTKNTRIGRELYTVRNILL